MSAAARPPRTFPELLAARLQGDPGQPLVTAYDDEHRRAHRAVGDDVRQLGQQDRQPAHRRARPRRGRHGAARPASALAGAGVPRRGLELGARRHHRAVRRPRPRGLRPGLARPATTAPTRWWPARCCPSRSGSPSRCRPGSSTTACSGPARATCSCPSDPPTPETPAWRTTEAVTTQAELLEAAAEPATSPGCGCSPTCTRPPGVGCRRSWHRCSARLPGAAAPPRRSDVARPCRGRAGRRGAAMRTARPQPSVCSPAKPAAM